MITKDEISELTSNSIKNLMGMMQEELDKRARAKRAELITQFEMAFNAMIDAHIGIKYDAFDGCVNLTHWDDFYFD